VKYPYPVRRNVRLRRNPVIPFRRRGGLLSADIAEKVDITASIAGFVAKIIEQSNLRGSFVHR
jgi:hypothetical protein